MYETFVSSTSTIRVNAIEGDRIGMVPFTLQGTCNQFNIFFLPLRFFFGSFLSSSTSFPFFFVYLLWFVVISCHFWTIIVLLCKKSDIIEVREWEIFTIRKEVNCSYVCSFIQQQEVRVSELFNTLFFNQQQEVRVSELINTCLH